MKGKQVVLGVTGGIAAFKAAALCSQLAQQGANVRVVMTRSATEFVTPLTFQALSRHDVYTDVFQEPDSSVIAHIDLADHADLVIIAPATANILAKMAHGIADDMLTATLLATQAPILIAPAMNVHMYQHPAVRQNMAILRERGCHFIEPGEGQLACGYVGKGRMAEPEDIQFAVRKWLHKQRDLQGVRMLLTAGPTMEAIDPVRYLSNHSSGKMGFAIAARAAARGATVTLISGPSALPTPEHVTRVDVTSAEEMYREVHQRFADQNIVVKAAAVADYRPRCYSEHKMKKTDGQLNLTLERTPDILAELGKIKTNQLLVGFAAETQDGERHAMAKLKRKNLDLIVMNDVSTPGAGFASDTNIVSIYNRDGLIRDIPQMRKHDVAEQLLDVIRDIHHDRT